MKIRVLRVWNLLGRWVVDKMEGDFKTETSKTAVIAHYFEN